MDSATTTAAPEKPPAGSIIFRVALICGTMDISAAFLSAGLLNDVSPAQVLRSVAGALLGPDARDNGGWAVAAFGLALHYAIATGWTALFYRLSRRWRMLTRRPVVCGLLYGALVYLAMNLAVVPFALWFRSLYLHTPVAYAPRLSWLQFGVILVCIGVPIAQVVRRYSRPA